MGDRTGSISVAGTDCIPRDHGNQIRRSIEEAKAEPHKANLERPTLIEAGTKEIRTKRSVPEKETKARCQVRQSKGFIEAWLLLLRTKKAAA